MVLRLKIAPCIAETGWRDMLLWQVPIDDTAHLSFYAALAHATGEAARRYREQQDWLSRDNAADALSGCGRGDASWRKSSTAASGPTPRWSALMPALSKGA
ncbi:MAG TPA: hypothetical protein VII06_21795 [Chloroflexota bacterium]